MLEGISGKRHRLPVQAQSLEDCRNRGEKAKRHGVSFFFFQAEDGIRDVAVTGVQTCALPISFLMASAHGAGLMVVPVLLRSNTVEAQSRIAGHNHISQTVAPLAGMLATGVHTVAYLAVTGLLAWVVYRKLGLALLRKAWLNFDLVWAAALVATGLVTLLI